MGKRHRPWVESLEVATALDDRRLDLDLQRRLERASNWSTGLVPGPNDDVVINVSGASPTITVDSSESVQSITASDPLVISSRDPVGVVRLDDQRRTDPLRRHARRRRRHNAVQRRHNSEHRHRRTFTVSQGATLDLTGGNTVAYSGTYTGTGPGRSLSSGNLVVGSGGATFDFPAGSFEWIGGGSVTATAGTLTNTGFITVDTSNGNGAGFTGTLTNQGTITFQNSGNNVGTFNGGTVDNQSAGVINISGIDGTAHGTPILNTTVNNSGTIYANSPSSVEIGALNLTGGVLDAQTGILIPWNGGGSVSTGGTLEAAAERTIQYNGGGNSTQHVHRNLRWVRQRAVCAQQRHSRHRRRGCDV